MGAFTGEGFKIIQIDIECRLIRSTYLIYIGRNGIFMDNIDGTTPKTAAHHSGAQYTLMGF